MSDPKPFQFHTVTDRGIRDATSVWMLAGHKVCIHATYFELCRGGPRGGARTQHFHKGKWRDVLPYHAIDYTPDGDTIDAHLALAVRTVEFLDA